MLLNNQEVKDALFNCSKINETTGCIEWFRCLDSYGYGRKNYKGVIWPAHRLSYEVSIGPIGELCVCHKCDNPKCINPEHLFLGTKKDNNLDCIKKDRHMHSLLSEQVHAIRADTRGREAIAKDYNINPRNVSYIKNGKLWGHLESPLVFMHKQGKCFGALNGSTKLTEDDVKAIRKSKREQVILSRQYGVHPSTIMAIKRHKTWKHITEEGVSS